LKKKRNKYSHFKDMYMFIKLLNIRMKFQRTPWISQIICFLVVSANHHVLSLILKPSGFIVIHRHKSEPTKSNINYYKVVTNYVRNWQNAAHWGCSNLVCLYFWVERCFVWIDGCVLSVHSVCFNAIDRCKGHCR
jgi:hypothetical protein